jgi:hypothetical protein
MTSRISHTAIDANDACVQSVFWSQVLGFTEDPDDPNEPPAGWTDADTATFGRSTPDSRKPEDGS